MDNHDSNAVLLRVDNITAGYDRRPVVGPLSFSINSGEIVALVGCNGAGKSTLIKALIGLVERMQGEVELVARDYAYIPETPWLYEELTLWEHLELVAMARGMAQKDFLREAEQILQQFRLYEVRHHHPGGFSKGMRQKILIMAAILAHPRLYIIDEPFSGLDAWAAMELMNWMTSERERGASIILSTHELDNAERICDRIMVMNHGVITASGTLDDLRSASGQAGTLFQIFLELTKG